jgi:Fic family protein
MADLFPLLNKIDALRAELDSFKPLKQEDNERLWKKFRLEWNFNSNHIEGNTLTYGQTELLLIFDKTTGDHEMREYEEMKAHDVAIKLIQEYARDSSRALTEADVRELNKIILVRPYWGNAQTPDGQPTRKEIIPGEYKKQPNSVRLQNGEMFHYASPEETPPKMADLMEWYRKAESEKKLHPLQLAAKLHYDFVRIHPFDDGNGRISRLLMNYVLLRHGFPTVVIKSADKRNYLSALNKADVGDMEAFTSYVGAQLIWSLALNIKAAKGQSIEEVGDLDKEIAILSTQLKSVNSQTKSPSVLLETFTWFSKSVWLAMRESLGQFNEFFTEDKEFHFVNCMPESFEKKNILENPFVKSTEPLKVKIFGRDIYDGKIDEVEWKLILYGLKGAKEKPEIEIRAKLKFDATRYYFQVQVEYLSIFELNCNYGEFILQSDVESLQTILKKQILDVIKSRI